MPNPWDVPYSSHVKIGDDNEECIFLAVGRALTKWEGLEAANGSLFAVLTCGSDDWHYQPAMRAFGLVTDVNMRGDMISNASEALFRHFNANGVAEAETDVFAVQIKQLVKQYTGWSVRRNDIAHGYVTLNQTHDYRIEDAPLIESYLLCPSHTNTKKWPLTWEPAYQYRAAEIDKFADAFALLDERATSLTEGLGRWCDDNIRKSR